MIDPVPSSSPILHASLVTARAGAILFLQPSLYYENNAFASPGVQAMVSQLPQGQSSTNDISAHLTYASVALTCIEGRLKDMSTVYAANILKLLIGLFFIPADDTQISLPAVGRNNVIDEDNIFACPRI